MVWCITLNGKKVNIDLQSLNDATAKVIQQYKALRVSLTEETGKKTSIIINPEKINIPGETNTSGKYFYVEN